MPTFVCYNEQVKGYLLWPGLLSLRDMKGGARKQHMPWLKCKLVSA